MCESRGMNEYRTLYVNIWLNLENFVTIHFSAIYIHCAVSKKTYILETMQRHRVNIN
jgi:hypothetical protein